LLQEKIITPKNEASKEIGRLEAEKEALGKDFKLVQDDLIYDRIRIDNLSAELAKTKSQKK